MARRVQVTQARISLLDVVDRRLEALYHSPRHGNYRDPTTELFYLLLTLRTRIHDVRPVMAALRSRCGHWSNLPSLEKSALYQILKPLGMWRKRAELLRNVAGRIQADFGCVSLTALKSMSGQDAVEYLRGLPGVGEKVARCVALYALDVDVSPMDVNATRVLSRIGVLPRNISPKAAHLWMDSLTPRNAACRLHVNCVAHGKSLCKTQAPLCHACQLSPICRYERTGS